MAQFAQIEIKSSSGTSAYSPLSQGTRTLVWLQGSTLIWMLIECAVSLYGAVSANSPALLAFGADSFVELLSATVVLLAIIAAKTGKSPAYGTFPGEREEW